ncbi:cellulose biosynthesis protein BcsD [Caulobacter sp. NIBR2454]|uniref:cellulose biosynthesis protein BcsD n=1 Tax=Caulobacter sp. NIBR2454 TaxID=3015996 RepID=UPI0022B6875A|nr:cellulose biosynthesis protein BcsD [Caulobacter sp. NIBR2454]
MKTPTPWMADKDVQASDLAYYRRTQRQLNPQWRGFLAALVGELHSGADPEEVRNFLRQVGRRMAQATPLAKVDTLEELETAMNKVWSGMDWGWVRLTAVSDGVRIVHGAYPDVVTQADEKIWASAWASVLEGAYTVWLQAQGSPIDKTLRASDGAEPLELFHGV